MTLTITLGWWLIPSLLVIAGIFVAWLGTRETGMMAGAFHGLVAAACWFAALVSVLTKVLA